MGLLRHFTGGSRPVLGVLWGRSRPARSDPGRRLSPCRFGLGSDPAAFGAATPKKSGESPSYICLTFARIGQEERRRAGAASWPRWRRRSWPRRSPRPARTRPGGRTTPGRAGGGGRRAGCGAGPDACIHFGRALARTPAGAAASGGGMEGQDARSRRSGPYAARPGWPMDGQTGGPRDLEPAGCWRPCHSGGWVGGAGALRPWYGAKRRNTNAERRSPHAPIAASMMFGVETRPSDWPTTYFTQILFPLVRGAPYTHCCGEVGPPIGEPIRMSLMEKGDL